MTKTENIFKKRFKVGVIGLGYVGLPLVNLFVKRGFEVFGIDNDNKKSHLKRV